VSVMQPLPSSRIHLDVAFNERLREGIIRIGYRQSWFPVLQQVPLVRWPEFIGAMRATEATHKAFRSN